MSNPRDADARSKATNFGICDLRALSCLIVLFASACSIPNLEAPECDQARDVVRDFYSRHFAEAERPAQDAEWRAAYQTSRLDAETAKTGSDVDPYTTTADRPKAFRAGECRVIEPDKRVTFQLLLFWKDDVRSEQQAINVEAEKVDGKWLIDRVTR